MLQALFGMARERQLLLFACACCRRVWHLLVDERSRELVEQVERYGDGLAERRELDSFWAAARDAVYDADREAPGVTQAAVAARNVAPETGWWPNKCWDVALTVARASAEAAAKTVPWPAEREAQAALLRDIFANPFHPLPPIDPAWLAWHDGVVKRLAQAAYEHRQLPTGHLDSARLAVLADALEDAGCSDADLLDHLRGPGPHVRGCWAVDLLSCRD
jgi:hypothetical protein